MAVLSKDNTYPPLYFVVGPTGTGKSEFALELAQSVKGEIVNADSIQMYQSTDIGSAKPTLEERALLPHHLYDFVPEGERFTAGRYFDVARKLIEDYRDKSTPLIFVGGSGFYLQALERGMYDVEEPSETIVEEIQSVQQQKGARGLHQRLAELDPEQAKILPEADEYRVIRALEMVLSKGKTMKEIQNEFEQQSNENKIPNPIVKIGLDRDRNELRKRVQLRMEKMITKGLVEEVKGLLDKGLEDWAPLKSVGYLETVQMIQNQLTPAEWKEKFVQNTMRFAKKQRTWFRRDSEIQWLRRV